MTRLAGDRHLLDWKFALLDSSVERVRNHVNSSGALSDATITLDVVVPTYRMNIAILEGIVGMEIPLSTSTLFIVIVDNPLAPNIADVLALERR